LKAGGEPEIKGMYGGPYSWNDVTYAWTSHAIVEEVKHMHTMMQTNRVIIQTTSYTDPPIKTFEFSKTPQLQLSSFIA
jgi:hypothetical protein